MTAEQVLHTGDNSDRWLVPRLSTEVCKEACPAQVSETHYLHPVLAGNNHPEQLMGARGGPYPQLAQSDS